MSGKLRRLQPIEVGNFQFVQKNTKRTAKQAIPSPTMLLRGGRNAVSRDAYPDLAEFHADIARVYQEELRELGEAGCRYVQLDDTNFAYLCDAKLRASFERWGYDVEEVPRLFAPDQRIARRSPAGRPSASTWVAHRGTLGGGRGYEPSPWCVRRNRSTPIPRYYDARSCGSSRCAFPALLGREDRARPVDQRAELESGTSSSGALTRLRVRAARAAVSAPCGLRALPRQPLVLCERRKLELVVEVARAVWGTAGS